MLDEGIKNSGEDGLIPKLLFFFIVWLWIKHWNQLEFTKVLVFIFKIVL